jgi:hypothetical protein
MDMKIEGYGYEWDAKLNGGPADGCVDIVIQINKKTPPKFIKRIIDGQDIERESLGEKLIEYLSQNNLDDNQKVAVYKLINFDQNEEGDNCSYDYVETITMKKFRDNYEY